MTILQDTRENRPLIFEHPFIDDIDITTLNVGDYGVRFKDGHTPAIYFERKNINDLFSTLGGGYDRFKREIIRAQETDSQLIIIIEGCIEKVMKGTEYSTLKGESIVKKLFTLWVKHNVIPVFCRDSMECAQYITQFYIAIGKEYMRKKKEPKELYEVSEVQKG